MSIAFFDTKPYDINAFSGYGERAGIKIKFFEAFLIKRFKEHFYFKLRRRSYF